MLKQHSQYRKDLQIISVIARHIDISGIVQGVGFRPFVYDLATRHGLTGEVCNTATGVAIHVEGASGNVETFCRDLTDRPPPPFRLTDVRISPAPVVCHLRFSITESRNLSARSTLILPEIVDPGEQ